MTVALIPVKELARAKARLAPVLHYAGRRELALAMFRDVLAAALGCRALDGVAVTSRDDEVLAVTEAAGAEALAEPSSPSAGSGQALNEALTSAEELLAARGVERVLVLAADLPLAAPEEIEAVARAAGAVAVVPSRDGGTNALALSPRAIEFRFGPDSARKHLDAGERAGLRTERLDLAGLALDIDRPDDLERLRAALVAGAVVGPNTRAALERLGLLAPAARAG